MNEKGNVYLLQGPVVCIETGDNPPKRIYVSCVPHKVSPSKKIEERARKIETFSNAVSGFISAGASVLMVMLVAHMIGVF